MMQSAVVDFTEYKEIPAIRLLIFSKNVDWIQLYKILERVEFQCSMNPRPQGDNSARCLLMHLLLREAPLRVVVAFVALYPDSLHQNVSAFFAACQVGSPEIIRFLIRMAVKLGDAYECPYPWITISHVTVEATKILLDEYPNGILQICEVNGRCPLDHMILSSLGQCHQTQSSDWYEKLKLMLQTSEFVTTGGCTGSAPIQTLLKAVLSKPDFFLKPRFACHIISLFRRLQVLYPDLFQIQDRNGDFPLHVAVKVKCQPGPCYNEARDLIALLLEAYPEAARLVSKARLPLHVALEQGWPCHDLLFKAAPDALQTRDTKTGLYPFQIAACSDVSWGSSKKKKGVNSLNVMYDLLRDDPCQAVEMLLSPTFSAHGKSYSR